MIDVDISLKKNYLTSDFSLTKDKYFIASKVRNILKLNQFDVTYKDYLYCNLIELIGEDMTPATAIMVKEQIQFTLEKFVPEITVTQLNIGVNESEQKLIIKLTYFINDTSEQVEQQIEIQSRN